MKRSGRKVEYDLDKIKDAVGSAINDVKPYTATELEHLASKIDKNISGEQITVEKIQDIVEDVLMDYDHKVAKEYILYRQKRNKTRNERQNSLLSKEFLSKYKHQNNPFPTKLGEFIYYRTYSRWLPKEERREYWWETVKRAVEYNCSLAPTTKKEAEELFDRIYNFKNFLAGRTLWTGGTEASKKYPMSNYNCAFEVIDDFKAYEDLFYLLLIGAGVGVRVLREDVEKLPKIRTDVKVRHEYYSPVDQSERAEFTTYEFNKSNTAIHIKVGDSKEAWVQALKIYLEALTRHEYNIIEEIYFNYDSVRPKGERLKTFGGTASGHQSIKKMFDKIDMILNKKDKEKVQLNPLDCLDIANIIGENVVSGGVRRTSEIGLFDADNENIKTAKKDLYIQKNGEWKINKDIEHRQMSNNSIFYKEKPSREQLHWHIKQMRYSGEPGFINAEEGKRRRDNFKGVNPCAEILLDSNGVCNLVSLNVKAFVEDGKLNREELLKSQRLNVRSSYRMALVEFELSDWDYINSRDRLVGLSLTGWQDAINALNWEEEKEKQANLLEELKEVANKEAEKVSEEYNDHTPELITTVKPEGTQTQMPTVSSGLHYNHSPYYIRRVRLSANDPLVKVAEELEWNVKDEVGENENTKVLEFPVKAPKGKVKGNVSAIEQLETYKMFMEHYVEHNASITVHVRDNEWEDVEEWLWNNWDSVVGVSFIPYNDSFYELMPYEEITKEEYEKMKNSMNDFKPYLVNKYERKSQKERELEQNSCEDGVCPVR
ncbi:MAG: ribonucleoside-triphosphate reductase, adenosylcobalamin-dependent [Clostridia bacterium]